MDGSSSASKFIEIPKFFFFSEKGIYSGSRSDRDFNYKAVPICPKEGDKLLRASYWSGEKCLDLSSDVVTREFPLTEEGHSEMVKWLDECCLARPEVKLPYKLKQELAEEIHRKNIKRKTE